MRCLLDTHTVIWEFTDSPELTATVKSAIDDISNDIYVSIVSIWELAIKRSLNRGKTLLPGIVEFLDKVTVSGFKILALEPDHIRLVESLPFYHRDPFDRLLISTAIAEDMTIISADENIQKYDVKWMW